VVATPTYAATKFLRKRSKTTVKEASQLETLSEREVHMTECHHTMAWGG
jgi:hypothetical protein